MRAKNSMGNPDEELVKGTVRKLIQHWDSRDSATQSRELVAEIRKLDSANFFSQLALETASKWSDNHTKSINFCLSFCASDWFCPVIAKCKDDPEYKKLILWICTEVSDSAEIPEIADGEKYEYDESDFPQCAEKSLCFMQFNTKFIKLLADTKETLFLKDVIKATVTYAVVAVCSNSLGFPWSNSKAVQAAIELQQILFENFKCSSLTELLVSRSEDPSSTDQQNGVTSNESILRQVLVYFRPKLSKGKWKQNPSYLKSFIKCLFATKSPHLGEHLDDFLPVALMVVDDFVKENKRQGVQCLSHIIENTSRTELIWQGRAEVIFEAVKLQLYSKEVSLLEVAIPCMLAILKVVESSRFDQGKIDSAIFRGPSKWDEIFNLILFNAEMESLLVLRRVYTRHLDLFIKYMGINVVKHSKRLLHLVSSYLETSDGPSETARFNTLLILNEFIYQAWPRVSGHSPVILKAVLRFIYDISVDRSLTPESVKIELMEKAKESLLLLKSVCSEDVNKCLRLMSDVETTVQCKHILQEVLET